MTSDNLKNIRNGCISGLIEISILYPLDLLKTRRHIQKDSLGKIVQTIYRSNGLVGFYRGILPPLLTEAPKRGFKFGFNEFYKGMLNNVSYLSKDSKVFLAGCLTGICESAIVTPSEVVKIRLQNSTGGETLGSVYKQIYSEKGLIGFTKGIGATCLRGLLWNATYFSIIEKTRDINISGNLYFDRFLGGSLAGLLATTINNPVDVIKSRIQSGNPKYSGIYSTAQLILRDNGWKGFYRGYMLKATRYTIGGGIMISIFNLLSV